MESRLEETFSMGIELHVVSSVVSRGQEMFCGSSRFRFGVRVIYGTAVFIRTLNLLCSSLISLQ